MPYAYATFERRLSECDARLSRLFEDQQINNSMERRIQSVKDYYNLSYKKAKKEETIIAILGSYEGFVSQLGKIKTGEIDAQTVQNQINDRNDSRKLDVIFTDLAKACELLFWAAASITLYASIFAIALPVLIVQPPLGIAISVATGGLILQAAVNFIKCFSEFRFLERHNQGYVSEASLLKFFAPAVQENQAEQADPTNACCAY